MLCMWINCNLWIDNLLHFIPCFFSFLFREVVVIVTITISFALKIIELFLLYHKICRIVQHTKKIWDLHMLESQIFWLVQVAYVVFIRTVRGEICISDMRLSGRRILYHSNIVFVIFCSFPCHQFVNVYLHQCILLRISDKFSFHCKILSDTVYNAGGAVPHIYIGSWLSCLKNTASTHTTFYKRRPKGGSLSNCGTNSVQWSLSTCWLGLYDLYLCQPLKLIQLCTGWRNKFYSLTFA